MMTYKDNMMDLKYMLLLLVLFSHTTFIDAACDYASVNKCSSDAGVPLDIENFDLPRGVSAEAFCGNMHPVISRCLDTTLKTCPRGELKYFFQGIKDGFDFLCSEGSAIFRQHQECLDKPNVEKALNVCTQNFEREVNAFKSGDDPCVPFQHLFTCGKAAGTLCGKEPGELLEKFFRELFDAAFKSASLPCNSGGKAVPTIAVIALGIISALFLGRNKF